MDGFLQIRRLFVKIWYIYFQIDEHFLIYEMLYIHEILFHIHEQFSNLSWNFFNVFQRMNLFYMQKTRSLYFPGLLASRTKCQVWSCPTTLVCEPPARQQAPKALIRSSRQTYLVPKNVAQRVTGCTTPYTLGLVAGRESTYGWMVGRTMMSSSHQSSYSRLDTGARIISEYISGFRRYSFSERRHSHRLRGAYADCKIARCYVALVSRRCSYG